MAIFYCDIKPVQRSEGRNAVHAAAYRRGTRLQDEHTGEVFDYRAKGDIAHSELTVPANAPAWVKALSAHHGKDPAGAAAQLWSRVERFEERSDAQLAHQIEVALPYELSLAENIALMREYVSEQLTRHGLIADWSIHFGKGRNIHAHVMLTMRPLTEEGFGNKRPALLDESGQPVRDAKGKIQYAQNFWGRKGDIRAARAQFSDYANRHLALAGIDMRIDHRSYKERGLDITPTVHIGVNAQHMDQRGKASHRKAEFDETRAKRAAEYEARPELVLEVITDKKAVFTRRDMAREIHGYIDDPARFQRLMNRLEASRELRQLAPERGPRLARYSTRRMIADENAVAAIAARLRALKGKGVDSRTLDHALSRFPELSPEQRAAVRHVTGVSQIALIAGLAGAGKSTAMAAARAAWEAAGFRVRGAALSGRAADELQQGSGIASDTLKSFEDAWKEGRDKLTNRDVLVIDEAGMIGSRQLGRVLAAAEKAGAKVVLVGDARQLQPIEAGAPFRAIAEQIGVAEINTIRRQRGEHNAWAREASKEIAIGDFQRGLDAYHMRGRVHFLANRDEAKAALARDWLKDRTPEASSVIFAHTNADVGDLNAAVRSARREAGELQGEAPFKTQRGERQFSAGDRVVFLRNRRRLGVSNGTLGTVEQAEAGRLSVLLDNGERREVDEKRYAHLDHGYAITLHKGQGATVDRAYVLASGGMDRHLAYVGMTRHRDELSLYAGRDEFADHVQMGRKLSRGRAKETTLDFAERRGIDTIRDWLDNGRAVLDAVVERLEWVRERLGIASTKEGRDQQLAEIKKDREKTDLATLPEKEQTRLMWAERSRDAAINNEVAALDKKAAGVAEEWAERIKELRAGLKEQARKRPGRPEALKPLIDALCEAVGQREHALNYTGNSPEARKAAAEAVKTREPKLWEDAEKGGVVRAQRERRAQEERQEWDRKLDEARARLKTSYPEFGTGWPAMGGQSPTVRQEMSHKAEEAMEGAGRYEFTNTVQPRLGRLARKIGAYRNRLDVEIEVHGYAKPVKPGRLARTVNPGLQAQHEKDRAAWDLEKKALEAKRERAARDEANAREFLEPRKGERLGQRIAERKNPAMAKARDAERAANKIIIDEIIRTEDAERERSVKQQKIEWSQGVQQGREESRKRGRSR